MAAPSAPAPPHTGAARERSFVPEPGANPEGELVIDVGWALIPLTPAVAMQPGQTRSLQLRCGKVNPTLPSYSPLPTFIAIQ